MSNITSILLIILFISCAKVDSQNGLKQVVSESDSKQSAVISHVNEIIEQWAGCELFHLSSRGTLSLIQDVFSQKYGTSYVYLSSIPLKAKYVLASEEIKIDNKHIKTTDVAIRMPEELTNQLKILYDELVITGGFDFVSIKDVMNAVDKKLVDLQETEQMGECFYYYISSRFHIISDRGIPKTAELPIRFKKMFKDIFAVDDKYATNDIQKELLKKDILNHKELNELQAMVKTSELFELNSPLKDDIGGWRGNFLMLSDVFTMCGEEFRTYWMFLFGFEKEKLLKFFELVKTQPSRYPIKNSKVGNHTAVLLRNKRTGHFFILDSWFESGGNPARIYVAEQWYARNNDQHIFR